MDVVVDEELFAIETIIFRTLFLVNKPSERRTPVMHPVMDGGIVKIFKLKF